jgi:RNA polymerase sigma factor (sigma-70 family)
MKKYYNLNEIISDYLKPIFSFTLKRTKTVQEAEDLAQEIIIKVYKALNNIDNIYNTDSYIWRIAHNTIANYYRGKSRDFVGVNIDDVVETIQCSKGSVEETYIKNEEINKLKNKIAYLSKVQRQIVILYYYHEKNQEEISQLLDITKGTIKWHLFEAKKELKKGMEKMDNKISELKFNPIKFSFMGVNGSVGREGGTSNFFKSTLAQNIVYSIYNGGKTINEIADLLGVSPVYVESEVEYLEEYSFLTKLPGNKYISNILIDEITEESLYLVYEMYRNASKLIVDEIFDEAIKSELINSEDIYYPDKDKNFLMWTLVLYILSHSKSGEDSTIKFEDIATIRKDGGFYIASASIDNPLLKKPDIFEYRDNWFGPIWNGYDNTILWQINSKWSTRNINLDTYANIIKSDIRLLNRYVRKDNLSSEEFSYLAEKGYIKGSIGQDKLNVVWLKNSNIRDEILSIGSKIKYKEELKNIKSDYTKMVLENTPKHLRKVREFELQDIFKCNGAFLLYNLRELLDSERLQEVDDEYKKKTIKTLLISNSYK